VILLSTFINQLPARRANVSASSP